MIPELGHFALALALCMALCLSVFPIWGAYRGRFDLIATARPAAVGLLVFVAVSYAALTYAFLVDDFSVLYVASNSNTRLPIPYKISAVWGAHEGSLLLWVLILSVWTAAVAIFSRNLPDRVFARVASVLGMVSIGFLLFILFTSNPFERLDPAPFQGRSLNPLLQDPGLVVHPPLLYMGYVGLSVAFAFSIAALLGGKLDSTWARWSRPWTTVAWVFLTLGITLGSWWAYNELGWGGWWFWDPVENASFMPWLIATALMHSLAITEKRGAFKSWTVLLAIMGFSMSLLGTFLVRSGVLTSVHAFATDPARGLYILIFLAVVIGGSLTLYAWRAPTIMGGGRFRVLSRETALLGNNLFLVIFTTLVLLGTLAPLIYDALGWGKISVGFPWFNFMFLVFTPPLAVLIGLGPLTRWKQDTPGEIWRRIRVPLAGTAVFAVAFLIQGLSLDSLKMTLGMTLAAWLTLATLAVVWFRVSARRGLGDKLRGLAGQSRSFWGMVTAHLGAGVFVVGVTLVSFGELEQHVRVEPGQTVEVGGYQFLFQGVQPEQGPNFQSNAARVIVLENDRPIAALKPEKRIYDSTNQPMTESGVDVGLTRDVYVTLGDSLGGGAWSLRIFIKPYVRWVWTGGLLMAIGGLFAVSDRRYRIALAPRKVEKKQGVDMRDEVTV